MRTKLLFFLMSFILSIPALAQDDELKCFVSSTLGEEIQLPKNEMKTPPGFPHLKGQSFQKTVNLQDATTANFMFTLKFKGARTFDFRISSINQIHSLHITAALDDQDMFQYTDYLIGVAVQCGKDYEAQY